MNESAPAPGRRERWADPGVLLTAGVGLLLLGFALSVDVPNVSHGFKGDEATYYSLTHSLARDRNFTFERRDLVRVWEEFPAGPEGIFLKRGRTIDIGFQARFPFLTWDTGEDPRWRERLHYGKAYIYPLFAAPFVFLFGTSGFLVLHALLMTLNVGAAYVFLAARSPKGPAALYALVFFSASAVPLYLVWLTPEFFNVSFALYALFLWSYKEVAPPWRADGSWLERSRLLRGPASDFLAAALIGILTYSKPTHIVLMLPLLGLTALRRQWRRGVAAGLVFTAMVGGLFLLNAAITGEFNYQGGDRKTFYGVTEFPFQHPRADFETTGMGFATDQVLFDVIFTRDALLHVLPFNIGYFLLGRHHGLVPYFFPGVLSILLFLLARGRRTAWQWIVAATIAISTLALLVYMPYTFSGGGGPVANRYFLAFYPLLLFMTPPLSSFRPALLALGVGALFTAQLLLNPFYVSFNPAEHPKHGPYRLLPVEMSLVNDLPISASPERARRQLAGEPPIQVYFLDDNAFHPEGEWFWVRGASRADLLLRAPIGPAGAEDSLVPLRLERLDVRLRNGPQPNRVTVSTRRGRQQVDLEPGETVTLALAVPRGFPYKPSRFPTNYIYTVSVRSERGFVPMFVDNAHDSRFLGVMTSIVPVYERR